MRKLARFLAPYRASMAVVCCVTARQALGTLMPQRLMATVVDRGIARGDERHILSIGGAMLLFSVAAAAAALIRCYLSSRIASGFGRTLRHALFERASCLSIQQLERLGPATLTTRTTNDVAHVQQLVSGVLTTVSTASMTAAGGVALVLWQDAQLAMILLGLVPVTAAVLAAVMPRVAVRLTAVMQRALDRLTLVVGEGAAGVRVIRAFDAAARQHERFAAANTDLADAAIALNRVGAILQPGLILTFNLTSAAVVWVRPTAWRRGRRRSAS